MKKIFLLLFLPSFLDLNSQNLVLNSGFEDLLTCPDGFDELYKAKGWHSCGVGTADFFYDCPSGITSGIGNLVPYNFSGYQQAHSGKGYGGFITYNGQDSLRVEIITTKLAAPLIKGSTYYIRFFVNKSNLEQISTNKIGARFSMNDCTRQSNNNINNFAHVYTDSIISDTLLWTQVLGVFVPDSAYKYVSFGNFFTPANTSIDFGAPFGGYVAYYYIDDICVSLDLNKCNLVASLDQQNNESVFTVFPNPSYQTVKVSCLGFERINSIIVKDIRGINVEIIDDIDESDFLLDFSMLENGVYFLTLSIGERNYNRRILKD
jgi:hypothetical protein